MLDCASMQNETRILHEKALQIAENYVRAESELIEILQCLDERKAFRELGYPSLYAYGTQALKLSESVTYNLITVARKSREIPKLQDKIRSREISLSNARKIAPVLTRQNQDLWLEAAANLPKRALEKKLAEENPKLAIAERVTPVSKNRLELKIGITEELHQALLQAQALLCSQSKKSATLEETLEAMTEFYLQKKDPVLKAERAEALIQKSGASQTEKPKRIPHMVLPNQRYLPAQIRHGVHLRDQGQCTRVDREGNRCSSRRWLDIHHVIPVWRGGPTTLENLVTLCRAHHQMIHAE